MTDKGVQASKKEVKGYVLRRSPRAMVQNCTMEYLGWSARVSSACALRPVGQESLPVRDASFK